jgi:hypothetical protein
MVRKGGGVFGPFASVCIAVCSFASIFVIIFLIGKCVEAGQESFARRQRRLEKEIHSSNAQLQKKED